MAAQDKSQDAGRGYLDEPEKDLFVWETPSRPFKKRGRDFWITVIGMASIGAFILFLIEGVMPVILIISVLFLFYVLSTVAPEKITCKITTKGVRVADRLNEWDTLVRYWFGERLGTHLLIFQTMFLPGRLELVILEEDREKIKKALQKFVQYEKLPPSRFDKAANWFAEKLPSS